MKRATLNTTKDYPLVTIAIPVYNGSKYLKEAIDSALNQTYDNIEIIVVNDGSNDDGKTERIALEYGAKIKYLTKENGGVATALNMAIENMSGTYFSWLSHDDVYYPEKVHYQIDYLKAYGDTQVIVYSNFDIIDSQSKITSKQILDHNMLVNKPLYGILRRYIHGCSLLIPKDAFVKYGLFNPTLKFTQDYDMWLRLSKHYNFLHLEKVLIQSRMHEEQDSKKHTKIPKEGNDFWSKCVEGLEENDILKCENTKMLFYLKMAIDLKNTPYYEGYNRSKQLAYSESPVYAFLFLQYLLAKFYLKNFIRFFLNKFKSLATKFLRKIKYV